ncbi:MAG: hypothetical protein ABIS14_03025 [Sphingomonas sp.]
MLFALFALDNVLVPLFLGKAGIAAMLALVACVFIVVLARSEVNGCEPREISWRTLASCFAIAALLLLLGGEGRFFFANEDWQVRDAVLADMALRPWPFAYEIGGNEWFLRAPLGMYLMPSLVGLGHQTTTDLALLGCNTLIFGLLLTLAATLFPAGRARWVALIVFISFSGLDIVGTLLAGVTGDSVSLDHIERWVPPLQYSSVITLIFWVPQHAFAGWFCGLLYLLHRRGGATFGSLAASAPIAAIWSPLAVIGAVPLIIWAALQAFHQRTIRWTDVLIPVIALILALPSLSYLAADAQRLPSGLQHIRLLSLITFLLLEVAPALWIIYRLGWGGGIGRDAVLLAAAMLAVIPFFHIGAGSDFVMRASIPPLAVVAAALATSLYQADLSAHRSTAMVVVTLLSLGAVTGTTEIARALRLASAPPPQCSLPTVWYRQTGWSADISSYLARAAAMPSPLKPEGETLINPGTDHRLCWARPWKIVR